MGTTKDITDDGDGGELVRKKRRLGPAQDIHFFYTRSNLSGLKSCALIFSTNSQFIFTFK